MDGRHVDQEATGQRHVAGDSRALLPKRFFGDLDDYVLTGLEHFRNELRPARGPGMAALMSAIVPGTAGPAGTALETLSRAASAAVGPAASSIVAAAITSATAIGALESRARISADAGGITWEVFTRRGRADAARRASFAGKKDD